MFSFGLPGLLSSFCLALGFLDFLVLVGVVIAGGGGGGGDVTAVSVEQSIDTCFAVLMERTYALRTCTCCFGFVFCCWLLL